MSTVDVKFFASLRDEIGIAGVQVAASSIGELMSSLAGVIGDDKLRVLQQESIRIAVNHSLVTGDCALAAGDEVAFLPPVTGG